MVHQELSKYTYLLNDAKAEDIVLGAFCGWGLESGVQGEMEKDAKWLDEAFHQYGIRHDLHMEPLKVQQWDQNELVSNCWDAAFEQMVEHKNPIILEFQASVEALTTATEAVASSVGAEVSQEGWQLKLPSWVDSLMSAISDHSVCSSRGMIAHAHQQHSRELYASLKSRDAHVAGQRKQKRSSPRFKERSQLVSKK